MSNELSIPTHELSKFDWNKKERTLTAEASDLGRGWMSRLYNDACDIGFAIRSPSGRTTKFSLLKEHTREGDITHWEFAPVSNIRAVSMVIVFND